MQKLIDNGVLFVYNASNNYKKEFIMALFNRGAAGKVLSERENMLRKHNVCRSNLLLLIIFTVVNIVLIAVNSESYFLFSAFIPYFITLLGAQFGGFGGESFLSAPVFYVALAISAVILIVYLLCWIFSKKHIAWLIVALVLFSVDTLCMLALYLMTGGIAEAILDVLFHGWVLYYLISGVVAYFKLKRIPEYEDITEPGAANAFIDNNTESDVQ